MCASAVTAAATADFGGRLALRLRANGLPKKPRFFSVVCSVGWSTRGAATGFALGSAAGSPLAVCLRVYSLFIAAERRM
jgi:hypothetical protein